MVVAWWKRPGWLRPPRRPPQDAVSSDRFYWRRIVGRGRYFY